MGKFPIALMASLTLMDLYLIFTVGFVSCVAIFNDARSNA
jgi:hypothetical protein